MAMSPKQKRFFSATVWVFSWLRLVQQKFLCLMAESSGASPPDWVRASYNVRFLICTFEKTSETSESKHDDEWMSDLLYVEFGESSRKTMVVPKLYRFAFTKQKN